MKKKIKFNSFKMGGICLIIVSLFFVYSNFKLTGFSINIFAFSNNLFTSLLPLITLFLGFFLFVSGDSLQNWLEKKESENPSKSLEGKLEKTEERELTKRYSGKPSFLKRLLGKTYVEQIPQKERISDEKENYEGEVKYGARSKPYVSENQLQELHKARERLIRSKKQIDKNNEEGIYDFTFGNYLDSGQKLKKLYGEVGISFPLEHYEKLKKKMAVRGFKKTKEELDKDIKENRVAFSEKGVPRFHYLKRLKEEADNEGKDLYVPSLDELRKQYLSNTTTIPISEVSKAYGVQFVHSIPLIGDRKHMQINNRAFEKSRDHRNMEVKEFLDVLLKKKPMLSTSTINPGNDSRRAVNFKYGVLLDEGNIYDAGGTEEVTAIGQKDGSRLRFTGGDSQLPIRERIREGINSIYKSTKQKIPQANEFIVGDYKLKGIFINEEEKDYMERARDVAKEAQNRGIPLYRFTKEKGFEEVSPRLYLK